MCHLEGELRRIGKKDLADIIAGVRGKLGRDFVLPQTDRSAEQIVNTVQTPDLFAKVYPEILLPEEHRRQGLILAGRFAARLGFDSPEAYIATLPDFPEKPANYDRLGLTVPLIVETRNPWIQAAKLSGVSISDYLKEQANAGKVSDWENDQFKMPEVPFSAWVQDGSKFVYRKPSDVREELLTKKENGDYRAGRLIDSIALWNVRPDMVKTMYWDIIGNGVGSGGAPWLDHWDVRPRLLAGGVDYADSFFRALVLGREIRTLNLAA